MVLLVTLDVRSESHMIENTTKINERQGREAEFPRLLGERLCLDFANSVETPLENPEEFLTDFTAVARWGRHAGLLGETQVAAMVQAETEEPALALRLYTGALVLRTGIQGAFQAIAEDRSVGEDDLDIIQQAYIQGLQHCQLTMVDGHARWMWAGRGGLSAVEFVLWEVAQSAVELLTDGEYSRIKTCDCGWLFYDTSRNGSRRWCSMEGCGTQAKMRRFTARRRAART
jgi:predicted RNA-binding Zn ribbon-like protein